MRNEMRQSCSCRCCSMLTRVADRAKSRLGEWERMSFHANCMNCPELPCKCLGLRKAESDTPNANRLFAPCKRLPGPRNRPLSRGNRLPTPAKRPDAGWDRLPHPAQRLRGFPHRPDATWNRLFAPGNRPGTVTNRPGVIRVQENVLLRSPRSRNCTHRRL